MQNAAALIAAARAASARGDAGQALKLSNQSIQQFPHVADAWLLHGQLNLQSFRLGAARKAMEQACKLQPDNKQLVHELAFVLEQLEAYAKLQKLLDQAIQRWPLDFDLVMNRARIDSHLGNFQAAKAGYVQVLKHAPDHVDAIFSMVLRGDGDEVGGLNAIEARLTEHSVGSPPHNSLNYARAYLLEKDEQYTEAFDAFREANALQAAAGGMKITAKQRGARAVISDLTGDVIERFYGAGNQSDRPVFIIGMPRSGTTLTEQILAAHPDVYATGEHFFWPDLLRGLITAAPKRGNSMAEAINSTHPDVWDQAGAEYLRRMNEINSESIRITDKMPANFALIPYIRLIFPHAHIIHIRREPLATLASCIRTRFAEPLLALSVEDWARFYGLYQALMDHWRPLLGKQMLEIDYEELVRDLPTQARRLIAFLGLDWHEACLHPERSGRAVRTASVEQVRQSVHTGAINKWRVYEAQLEALRPLIAESRASLVPNN